jgi:hypothetical protein
MSTLVGLGMVLSACYATTCLNYNPQSQILCGIYGRGIKIYTILSSLRSTVIQIIFQVNLIWDFWIIWWGKMGKLFTDHANGGNHGEMQNPRGNN